VLAFRQALAGERLRGSKIFFINVWAGSGVIWIQNRNKKEIFNRAEFCWKSL